MVMQHLMTCLVLGEIILTVIGNMKSRCAVRRKGFISRRLDTRPRGIGEPKDREAWGLWRLRSRREGSWSSDLVGGRS
ncbi:hypothetical protein GUJ93_ZPchr0016g2552 [Zizania palustris]|uniref:Secreted protein n=1 Tax=Zizania palustris TaxID=103762 RepID=A0A8J5T998_ZIZPA|nr:hypothetical protein GUJ93_ZPchr0016g2552 [Zizania palustris]